MNRGLSRLHTDLESLVVFPDWWLDLLSTGGCARGSSLSVLDPTFHGVQDIVCDHDQDKDHHGKEHASEKTDQAFFVVDDLPVQGDEFFVNGRVFCGIGVFWKRLQTFHFIYGAFHGAHKINDRMEIRVVRPAVEDPREGASRNAADLRELFVCQPAFCFEFT